MNALGERIQRIGLLIIAATGTAIFFAFTYYTWRYTAELDAVREAWTVVSDRPAVNFAILAVALALIALAGKLEKLLAPRILHIAAVVLSVCVTLCALFLVKEANARAIADQEDVYLAAVDLFMGDYESLASRREYLDVYPFQATMVLVFEGIFKLAGSCSQRLLQNINAVCAGLAVYLGFRIVRDLFQSAVTFFGGALIFIPHYVYTLFVYGESMGVLSALLGVWCFLRANRSEKRGWKAAYWCGVGVSMILMYLVRSALMVIWIAMLIIQVLSFLRDKRWKPLLALLVILLAMSGAQKLSVAAVEKQSGLELKGGMPMESWLVMGLQYGFDGESPGSFNFYGYNRYINNDMDKEKTAAQARTDLRARLEEMKENPAEIVPFFKGKILNQWNEPSYGAMCMTDYMEEPAQWVYELYHGEAWKKIYAFMNGWQAVFYPLVLFYFVSLFREKDPGRFLPGLALIGEFFLCILWEAKSRYIYPYVLVALPAAAYGAACSLRFISLCGENIGRRVCGRVGHK